jgi:hypothetical protein
MALQFPSNPTIGQTYQSGSSATYQWVGTYWDIIVPPEITTLLAVSASYALSSSYSPPSLSSSFSSTASFVATASWANNAVSASYATTASYLVGDIASASFALTASFASTASFIATASWARNAVTASHLLGSVTSASFASTASFLTGKTAVYFCALKSNLIQSIPSATNTVVVGYDTPLVNTAPSAWNSALGTFVVPETGIYEVFAQFMFGFTTAIFTNEFAVLILRNGTVVTQGDYWAEVTGNIARPTVNTSVILSCNVNDQLQAGIFQNLTGAAINLSVGRNIFSIKQLPLRI